MKKKNLIIIETFKSDNRAERDKVICDNIVKLIIRQQKRDALGKSASRQEDSQ
jgi:hypothetical protein